jgi:FKBP-type peptidyl-prolyl cis-trans isomerase
MRFVATCALLACLPLAGCGKKPGDAGAEPDAYAPPPKATAEPAVKAEAPAAKGGPKVKTPSGLEYEDVKVGTGAEAKAGQTVTVHYAGTLDNGTEFDASRKRGKPFDFRLGASEVIRGWDEGVAGMKVGGLRKLTIPSDLGYGDAGQPPTIPPKATLHFEVELLGVK